MNRIRAAAIKFIQLDQQRPVAGFPKPTLTGLIVITVSVLSLVGAIKGGLEAGAR